MMIVDIKIDQYGEGHTICPIYQIEIGNLGCIRSEGFGNDYCKYSVRLWKINNETMQRYGSDERELIEHTFIEEHNRRDGAVELVRKACELMENRT